MHARGRVGLPRRVVVVVVVVLLRGGGGGGGRRGAVGRTRAIVPDPASDRQLRRLLDAIERGG